MLSVLSTTQVPATGILLDLNFGRSSIPRTHIWGRLSVYFTFFRAIRMVVLFLFLLLPTVASGQAQGLEPEATKLSVLLNYDPTASAGSAEDVVQALNNPTQSSSSTGTTGLSNRFQNPLHASLLLSKRLPHEYRQLLPADDPDELLHRYIVLEFSTNTAAIAAKGTLQKDPAVLYVHENTFARFLTAPADPLYATTASVKDYQWGINDPLNLQAAWSLVRPLRTLRILITASNRASRRPPVSRRSCATVAPPIYLQRCGRQRCR